MGIQLTDKQLAVVALVRAAIESKKPFDATRSAETLGLTVNGVRDHLNRLKQAGVIDWVPKKLETLKILVDHTAMGTVAPKVVLVSPRAATDDAPEPFDRDSVVTPAITGPLMIDAAQAKTIVDHVESMIAGGLAALRVIRDLPSAKQAMRAMMDKLLGEPTPAVEPTRSVMVGAAGQVLGHATPLGTVTTMAAPRAVARTATAATPTPTRSALTGYVVRNRHGEQIGPVYADVIGEDGAMKAWKRDRLADVVVSLATGSPVTQPKHRTELRSDDADVDPDELEAERDAEMEDEEDA